MDTETQHFQESFQAFQIIEGQSKKTIHIDVSEVKIISKISLGTF